MNLSVPDRIKSWAGLLKRDAVALWIAARDERTPLLAKILAAAVAAYALSPIDLIPDFVPIVGYLDDLVLVPLGIACVVRLIPGPLMADFRAAAALRIGKPASRAAAWAIVAIWAAALAIVASAWLRL